MCAAKNNRLDVVNFILDNLDVVDLNAVDVDQQTALHHAAIGGHLEIVEKLVHLGAIPTVIDKVNNLIFSLPTIILAPPSFLIPFHVNFYTTAVQKYTIAVVKSNHRASFYLMYFSCLTPCSSRSTAPTYFYYSLCCHSKTLLT